MDLNFASPNAICFHVKFKFVKAIRHRNLDHHIIIQYHSVHYYVMLKI